MADGWRHLLHIKPTRPLTALQHGKFRPPLTKPILLPAQGLDEVVNGSLATFKHNWHTGHCASEAEQGTMRQYVVNSGPQDYVATGHLRNLCLACNLPGSSYVEDFT